jgi:hypothetical protein
MESGQDNDARAGAGGTAEDGGTGATGGTGNGGTGYGGTGYGGTAGAGNGGTGYGGTGYGGTAGTGYGGTGYGGTAGTGYGGTGYGGTGYGGTAGTGYGGTAGYPGDCASTPDCPLCCEVQYEYAMQVFYKYLAGCVCSPEECGPVCPSFCAQPLHFPPGPCQDCAVSSATAGACGSVISACLGDADCAPALSCLLTCP